MAAGNGRTHAASAEKVSLAETDLAIIRYLSRGLSNKEIAPLVHLSPHTVKDRLEKIRAMLDARSRTGIIGEAYRRGLLLPP